MKDEQKVYIRGVEGRGDEVIKALTDLGAVNGDRFPGDGHNSIYYISHDGIIQCKHVGSETAKIIMDNYREIKLPEKFQDGDFIAKETYLVGENHIVRYRLLIGIVSKDEPDGFTSYHFSLEKNDIIRHNFLNENKITKRFATEEEKQWLLDKMHSNGLDWDAEKKEVVKWWWKPNDGEYYYYVSVSVFTLIAVWNNDNIDKTCYNNGNCFRTKEEAEAMAEKIKKLLKGE